MKKVLLTGLSVACICITTALHAQDTTSTNSQENNTKDSADSKGFKHTIKKAGDAIEKGAKAVGNKTAELASKGKAGVVDKVYDGKKGPDGQKIYINDESKYYWIDKKGRRQFVSENELKDDNK